MTVATRHPPFALAILAGLALLLQSLSPAGWMPAAATQGPALVLCTGTGPVTMPGMGGRDGDVPSSHHAPGLFGALPATPPLPAVCPPPRQIAVPAPLPPAVVPRAGQGLGTPPRPSTGPPPAA